MTTRYHLRVRNLSERRARLIHDQSSLPISFLPPSRLVIFLTLLPISPTIFHSHLTGNS